MSIRVRAVLSGDWEKLRNLRLRSLATDPDAFGGTYERDAGLPASIWKERAGVSERGEQSRCFVAVTDRDEWVGMALAATDEFGKAHLFGMWVQPESRGSAAAALLCEACASWATSQGHEALDLSVVVDNPRATAFYRKAGFLEVGTKVADFGDRSLPVTVMRRPL